MSDGRERTHASAKARSSSDTGQCKGFRLLFLKMGKAPDAKPQLVAVRPGEGVVLQKGLENTADLMNH